MKFSARATAVALTACAGIAAAAGTAAATALNPQQLEAAEQNAAGTRVPFDLPLTGALRTVTGDTSMAGLHGSLPGMPLVPPSAVHHETHSLLPNPLVPPLRAADGTPELNLTAPLVGGDGTLRQDGIMASLPQAPLKAVGGAASLGEPITYSGATSSAPADEVIDLGKLAPALTPPRVQSAPNGMVTLDQRSTERPIGRTVQDFLATATATAQELSGH